MGVVCSSKNSVQSDGSESVSLWTAGCCPVMVFAFKGKGHDPY